MLKFIPFCGEGKKIIKAGSAKNALGIGAGSKNPERALMLIDYLVGSKYSDQILGYGYEGKIMDYSLFEDDPANHELLYIKDPYDKFVFDKTPVQNEIDNILLVNSQFGVPILLGRAGDPSTAVNRYRQELEAAGIHKVIDAVKEQLKDY
jgi:putative aldouronate transport system substrate-binding protein